MNTSVLTLGMPALLVAVGLMFASPDQSGSTVISDEATQVEDDSSGQDDDTFEPAWLDDLGLATSIAAERDKPMMVVFR